MKENNDMTDTEKKIERLYDLLDELEAAGRTDDAAAVRWAIFQIESK